MTKRRKIIIGSVLLAFLVIVSLLVSAGNGSSKTAVQPSRKLLYVALGDSVAAGEGLPTYTDSSACNRTAEAYPTLLAHTKNYTLHTFSCSGATLDSGVLGPQTVNTLALKSQLDALKMGLKPDLLTLTIGANDVQWTNILRQCSATDCGTAEDTASIQMRLDLVAANLQAALSKIRELYPNAPPKVAVTGYYQLLPAVLPDCLEASGLTQQELNWERDQQTKLNSVISSAVQSFGFARFVPIDFTGHELCSNDPWIQDLTAKAPFHPTEDGHKAYLKALL